MLQVKQEIIEKIKESLKELGIEDENINLEIPEDLSHGDYTCNIAFALAKKLKKNPAEIAKDIASSVQRPASSSLGEASSSLEKVEAVGGFVNFYLSKEYLLRNLQFSISNFQSNSNYKIFQKDSGMKGKTILVEFTDPNPFKEFHIGHLYSNTVGESISRLLESQGFDVKRLCYQGDVGMHVAKAVWGMLNQVRDEKGEMRNEALKELEDKSLDERIKFLGEAYKMGAKAYEENEDAKREIIEINKIIYSVISDKNSPRHPELAVRLRSGPEPAEWDSGSSKMPKLVRHDIKKLYEKGKAWSLEYFDKIYKKLGMRFSKTNKGKVFDRYYFESEVADSGVKIVEDNKEIFEKSEGAVIFPGEKYGLHSRVFINSLGLPTYEAKELALAFAKDKDFKEYEQSIIITGNEINEYFKVLLKVISLVKPARNASISVAGGPEIATKTKHLSHGMVRLPTGKMASRKGDVITGEGLLQMVFEKIKDTYSDMPEESISAIGVGAVKYALLKSSVGHDIVFSFEESINLNGNSGPYIQYAYVRTQSILAKSQNVISHLLPACNAYACIAGRSLISHLNKEESDLLRIVSQYEEVLRIASENFAPNVLCNYLYNLAKAFNLFYQKHRILPAGRQVLDAKDVQQKQLRLSLVAGVGTVIKNGLYLLGIETPEKM